MRIRIVGAAGVTEFGTSAEDSRKLNGVNGPCVILAGAGMCNADGSSIIEKKTFGGPRAPS